MIRFEERDVYLKQEFRDQLKLRMRVQLGRRQNDSLELPSLFVDGQHVGVSLSLDTMISHGCLSKITNKY